MESAAIREEIKKRGFAIVSKTFGKSMRPLLWGGDHCVVAVPLEGAPAVGDLLLFRWRQAGAKQKNVVHRLVEIREKDGETLYITRGDNCIGVERIRRADIIGRIAEIHRLSGYRPWHILPWKKITVEDRGYRWYSSVWGWLWPIRRIWYRIVAKI